MQLLLELVLQHTKNVISHSAIAADQRLKDLFLQVKQYTWAHKEAITTILP
jgi:hypothetical protein